MPFVWNIELIEIFEYKAAESKNEKKTKINWVSSLHYFPIFFLFKSFCESIHRLWLDMSLMQVQRARKSKISGIMSAVWKYHNENVEDDSNSMEGNAWKFCVRVFLHFFCCVLLNKHYVNVKLVVTHDVYGML